MENDQSQEMSSEQAADLAALQSAAANGEPPRLPGEAESAAPGEAEKWAMLPMMIGTTLQMAMPEIANVYTPEACMAWGKAMEPVAEKYGWNADSLCSVEMGLAAVTLPMVVGTMQAVQAFRERTAQLAMNKQAVAKAQPVVPGTDAGKSVTFGNVPA